MKESIIEAFCLNWMCKRSLADVSDDVKEASEEYRDILGRLEENVGGTYHFTQLDCAVGYYLMTSEIAAFNAGFKMAIQLGKEVLI